MLSKLTVDAQERVIYNARFEEVDVSLGRERAWDNNRAVLVSECPTQIRKIEDMGASQQ
jgi:hypothetical protein